MPATRSRTENWRRSLEQIASRGGSIEITLESRSNELRNNNAGDAPETKNLIWRVRIHEVRDDGFVVERPMALGQGVDLHDGAPIVGLYSVGQNRWMFQSRILSHQIGDHRDGRDNGLLLLEAPKSVERCQRRNFYRISTVGLQLPRVEAFPLFDSASTAVAETACRHEVEQMIDSDIAGKIGVESPQDLVAMPEVGPGVPSQLVNLGGGGVGLVVEDEHRRAFESHRSFWLRIDLRPQIPAPLGVAARLRHTNLDSAKRLYAGMVFDFSNGSRHQQFIVSQLCKYVAETQRESA